MGPFIYTGVVFAGGLDWLLWSVLPYRLFFAGAVLVCLSAILVLRMRPEAELAPGVGT